MKKLLLSLKTLLLCGAFCINNQAHAQAGATLNFNGTDYVNCLNTISSFLNGTNKITVEALVKPDGSASNLQHIVGNYSTNGGSRMQFLLRASPSAYEFNIGNSTLGGWVGITSTVAPSITSFDHVAGVWDGTVATLYVNGVVSGTASVTYSSFINFTGSNVFIGGNSLGENFSGQIDEVRIWNVARTKCNINTYKNCEIHSTAPGLLANYHFNQGIAGGTNTGVNFLFDASGYNINGSLIGFNLSGATSNWVAPGGVISGFISPLPSPTMAITANPSFSICPSNTIALTATGTNVTYTWTPLITNGVPFSPVNSGVYECSFTNTLTTCTGTAYANVYVSTCSGTPGSALNFNGTDGVDLGSAITSSLGGTNKLTVEAWVNPSSTAVNQNIVGNYRTIGPDNMQFLLRQSGSNYEFWIGNGAVGSYSSVIAPVSATVNVWQHVAATWNGSVATFYINGVLKSTTTIGLAALSSTITNPVVLGTNAAGQNFNGSLDEVRIWKSARTRCEINTFKDCEIPTGATNLLANYHFNQGFAGAQNPTVTVLNDASGNNINGTLNTFSLTNNISNWIAPGGVTNGFTTPLPAPSSLSVSSTNSVACINNAQTITAAGTPTISFVGVCGICSSVITNTTAPGATTFTIIGTAANTCTTSVNFTQTFVLCTSIEELESVYNMIAVFPNPNNGQFTVNLNTNVTLSIYNSIGQTVSTEKLESGNYIINLNHLSKGMYMIEAVSGNQRQLKKLIVE